MVTGQRDSIQSCSWLWGKVERIPRQSWRLDPWTRGTRMDHSFSNRWRTLEHQFVPSSTFYSVFLIHCLHCLRIFPTKVSHPSLAGSLPRLTHNPGWGFTTWISLMLHLLMAAERPGTFWRMPSSAVLKVGQSVKRGLSQPPLPPQHPSTSRKTLRQFHREVFLLAPRLQYTLPPSANTLDPPLHSNRNLAPPLAGAQHQDADPGEAAQVHWVCRVRVLDLVVAVGPGVGPRLGLKPVRVLDQFARLQRRSEALRFSLGIKQVRASTMCHTPLTKQMCPRGAYLCSTFQPLTTMKLANAKHVTMRTEVTRLMPHGKEKQTSDGIKGIEERDQMVNDYTDGKRRPKNPDPLGPPVSYMEDRGVFQPLTSPTNTFGLCHFYRADPNTPMPSGPVSPATAEHVKRLVLLASTTPRRYVLMVFRGGTVTALGLLQELHTQSALVRIPYLPIWRRQGRARRTCVVLSILRAYHSKTIWPILTILSACIMMRASDVVPVSVP